MVEAPDQKRIMIRTPSKKKKKKENIFSERIQIRSDANLHKLCLASAQLFNIANNIVHSGFKMFVLCRGGTQKAGGWVRFYALLNELQGTPAYRALPAQSAQEVLYQVDAAWKGFFEAMKAWNEDPSKFRARPSPPGWKAEGEVNLLTFTNQQCKLKYDPQSGKAYIQFPKSVDLAPVQVNPYRIGTLQQVCILPRGHYAIVEIVYKRDVLRDSERRSAPQDRIAALDLGVRNVVCLVTNCGMRPVVVQGGAVKSMNQYYNKKKAEYQKMYSAHGVQGEPRRLERLTRRRNNKIEDQFHKLSSALIGYLSNALIDTLVIGYNEQWKQNAHLGRRNNQNFVNIPFYRLVEKLQYKASLAGIKVVLIEESYTSKCSLLDKESIEHHENYVGTRGVWRQIDNAKFQQKHGKNGKVCHGLFKTATGRVVNSDVNGAYNILRKAFPKALAVDGIEGRGLVPIAVKFSQKEQDFTGLKQLAANLDSSTDILPNAISADGSEALGSAPVRGTESAKTPGEDRTQHSLLNLVNKGQQI